MIPFEDLKRVNETFEGDLLHAFEEVIRSGRYILGENLAAFEGEFAESLTVAHAVGVGSGYDAISLAFMGLGLDGGEVIIPANTYMATILAVVRVGLTPVLSDPDPTTLLIDPEDVRRRVTPRTVALLPVHLYGLVCDMDALMPIAERHGLAVVEDCAQAHGAAFRGRPVGAFGHASAFSFYPTKNLGALGDGGAVVTSDERAAERVRMLRNYGVRRPACADEVGFNSRLDEMQAAFLRVKLARLREICERKNALAGRYEQGLSREFARPLPLPGAEVARHLFPVLHAQRDDLRQFLSLLHIATHIHYPIPPHRQPALVRRCPGEYPVSDKVHREIVSLPLSYAHADGEIDAVIEAANRFAAQVRSAP